MAKLALVENAVSKLERQIKNNISSCFSTLIGDINTNLNTIVQSIFRNAEKLEDLVRQEATELKNDILVQADYADKEAKFFNLDTLTSLDEFRILYGKKLGIQGNEYVHQFQNEDQFQEPKLWPDKRNTNPQTVSDIDIDAIDTVKNESDTIMEEVRKKAVKKEIKKKKEPHLELNKEIEHTDEKSRLYSILPKEPTRIARDGKIMDAFECDQGDQCSYASSRRKNLVRHILTVHKKVKNYRCEKCGQSLSEKRSLERHIEKIHGQEGS